MKKQAVLQNGKLMPNGSLNSHANGNIGAPKAHETTDASRWRLFSERGRQTWHYLTSEDEVKAWPQSIADRYFLGLPTVGKVWSG